MNIENRPTTFSVAEAKAKFSELLSRAEAGERLTVTRHGRPIVEITASADAKLKPKLRGAMKGQIWIAPDFDELGPEWDEYVK
jgi:prevent-host-death family protein